jgi:TMEM175 potassium channel family protein
VSRRWATGRTEGFSDAVFAIAATLLVLEINVERGSFDNLWTAIAHQWPSYLAYATSFLTIGGLWLAHHGIFARLRYLTAIVMRVNLILLMMTAFLPFPTKLMAEAIRNTEAERAAVVFYGSTLLVISGLLALLWQAAIADRGALRPEVSDAEVSTISRATAPNPAGFLTAMLIAFFAPHVAALGYLIFAIAVVIRARGDTDEEAEAETT